MVLDAVDLIDAFGYILGKIFYIIRSSDLFWRIIVYWVLFIVLIVFLLLFE